MNRTIEIWRASGPGVNRTADMTVIDHGPDADYRHRYEANLRFPLITGADDRPVALQCAGPARELVISSLLEQVNAFFEDTPLAAPRFSLETDFDCLSVLHPAPRSRQRVPLFAGHARVQLSELGWSIAGNGHAPVAR